MSRRKLRWNSMQDELHDLVGERLRDRFLKNLGHRRWTPFVARVREFRSLVNERFMKITNVRCVLVSCPRKRNFEDAIRWYSASRRPGITRPVDNAA
jgi:hypothetical protein